MTRGPIFPRFAGVSGGYAVVTAWSSARPGDHVFRFFGTRGLKKKVKKGGFMVREGSPPVLIRA